MKITLTIETGKKRAPRKPFPLWKWLRSQKGRNEVRAVAIVALAMVPHTASLVIFGLLPTIAAFSFATLAVAHARLALDHESVSARLENAERSRDNLTAHLVAIGNPNPKPVQPKPDWLANMENDNGEDQGIEIDPYDGHSEGAARG